jgi:hypothetical protein
MGSFVMEMANFSGSILANQGFMFWSATSAVALGFTLVVTAGFIHFRRLRSRSGRPDLPARVALPDPVVIGADIPLKKEMNEDSPKDILGPGSSSIEPDTRQLRLLLARLRTAADQLEDFRHSRLPFPAESSESSLKELPEAVDYLFRTGTG